MSLIRWLPTFGLLLLCWGCPAASHTATDAEDEVAEATAEENPPADAAPPEQPAEPAKRPNALEREAELVDKQAYLAEHPNAIEKAGNEITAVDPFSSSLQGFQKGIPQVTMPMIEQQVTAYKLLHNDQVPTVEQLKADLESTNFPLRGLKKNQVYGYDVQTGKVSILEIPEEKPAP